MIMTTTTYLLSTSITQVMSLSTMSICPSLGAQKRFFHPWLNTISPKNSSTLTTTGRAHSSPSYTPLLAWTEMRKSYKSDFVYFILLSTEDTEVLHAWQNVGQPSSLIFSMSATITVRKGVRRRITSKLDQQLAVTKREEADSLHNLSLSG